MERDYAGKDYFGFAGKKIIIRRDFHQGKTYAAGSKEPCFGWSVEVGSQEKENVFRPDPDVAISTPNLDDDGFDIGGGADLVELVETEVDGETITTSVPVTGKDINGCKAGNNAQEFSIRVKCTQYRIKFSPQTFIIGKGGNPKSNLVKANIKIWVEDKRVSYNCMQWHVAGGECYFADCGCCPKEACCHGGGDCQYNGRLDGTIFNPFAPEGGGSHIIDKEYGTGNPNKPKPDIEGKDNPCSGGHAKVAFTEEEIDGHTGWYVVSPHDGTLLWPDLGDLTDFDYDFGEKTAFGGSGQHAHVGSGCTKILNGFDKGKMVTSSSGHEVLDMSPEVLSSEDFISNRLCELTYDTNNQTRRDCVGGIDSLDTIQEDTSHLADPDGNEADADGNYPTHED